MMNTQKTIFKKSFPFKKAGRKEYIHNPSNPKESMDLVKEPVLKTLTFRNKL